MAGGLALVAPDRQRVVSSSLGAIAKDVWVIAAEAEAAQDPWLSSTVDEPMLRQLVAVSPRTAENLFWMGRYAERSGDLVRLLRATVDRWYDHARRPASPGGRALAVLLDALDARLPAGWARPADDSSEPRHLRSLLLARDEPGTVAWSVRRMAEAAAAVRDQLSNDTWLPLASMERALEEESEAKRAVGSTTGPAPRPRPPARGAPRRRRNRVRGNGARRRLVPAWTRAAAWSARCTSSRAWTRRS